VQTSPGTEVETTRSVIEAADSDVGDGDSDDRRRDIDVEARTSEIQEGFIERGDLVMNVDEIATDTQDRAFEFRERASDVDGEFVAVVTAGGKLETPDTDVLFPDSDVPSPLMDRGEKLSNIGDPDIVFGGRSMDFEHGLTVVDGIVTELRRSFSEIGRKLFDAEDEVFTGGMGGMRRRYEPRRISYDERRNR
jgi:hypothetical protein